MSEDKKPTSVKLDEDTEAALAYVLQGTKLKKHAVLVAAIREGLRIFIQDKARLNAAHAKEDLPRPLPSDPPLPRPLPSDPPLPRPLPSDPVAKK